MANNPREENARIIKRSMAHDIHEMALAVEGLKEAVMAESLADMRRLSTIIRVIKEALADAQFVPERKK